MAYRPVAIEALLGLNEDENPHALKPGELTSARNAARRSTTLVGTRPGCVALGAGEDYENALVGTPAIQGAVEYRQNFDAGRALVTIANNPGAGTDPNSKIWVEDDKRIDDTVTPVITAGADNIWTFALHNNLLWGAGGAAADDVWTWDGDQATPSAPVIRALTDKASTNRLRPKFVKEWRGYVLVNGLRGGASDSNNPAISRYQTFGTDPTVDGNWLDGNSLGYANTQVGTDAFGGAYTTGFGQYQDNRGDFLIVLSNNQLVSYIRDPSGSTDFLRNDIIANGCVHQRAFVDLGPDAGDAIYQSREGVHSLRVSQQHGTSENAFLSRKIETTFNSLNPNRRELSCAAYDRKHGRIVFAWSTGSSARHDILMALDVRDPETLNSKDALWYGPWIISGQLNINHLLYARDNSGNFHLYAFTTAGRVLRFDEDVFHDVATGAYEVVVQTKHEAYGSIALEKRLGDTMVHVQPGGSHAIQVSTIWNYGEKVTGPLALRQPDTSAPVLPVVLPFVVGADEISSDVKLYTSGRGRAVAQQFYHNAADEPFFLGRIERQVAGAGEDTGAATQA